LNRLIKWLRDARDPAAIDDVLRGILIALAGQRSLPAPTGWAPVRNKLINHSLPSIRDNTTRLAVIFNDADAIKSLRRMVQDPRAVPENRRIALQGLLAQRDAELLPVLRKLLDESAMRSAAIRGLAAYGDEGTPELLLKRYALLSAEEKSDVVQTLASRPTYATALLAAVEQGRVPRADVSALVARQILNLNSKPLAEKLAKVWGQIRPASQERAALTAKYKAILAAETLTPPSRSRGRLIFNNTCASCHRLYDSGGDIGPALTGSQRSNLDYLLENVLDPSAVVAKEYQVSIVRTASGRTLNGIVKQETDKALTIQTQNELVIVPKDEIEDRRQSNMSMMPDGLFDKLTEQEVRDLVAYLQSTLQVPLPMGK
jgi:putative heme-binding domain-containing protein